MFPGVKFGMVPLIIDTLIDTAEESIEGIVESLPTLLLFLVVLLIGVFVATWIRTPLERLVMQVNIATRLEETPIDDAIDENQTVVRLLVVVVQVYVLLFAVLVAADLAEITIISQWAEILVLYVPSALGGLLIFLVGFIAANAVSRQLRGATVIQESNYGSWIVGAISGTILFVAAVIGLEMLGFELQIIYLIVDGLASAIGLGIAAAIALALGVVAGFYARDYLNEESVD